MSGEKIKAFPLLTVRKAHKRIVWDCCWYRDDHIATVSRDGACKLWKLSSTSDGPGCDCLFEFSPFEGVPVTAVDICSLSLNRYLIALGCENGRLSIWEARVPENNSDVTLNPLTEASSHYRHGLTVRRMRWSPESTNDSFKLASVGEDHTVRIYSLRIPSNDV